MRWPAFASFTLTFDVALALALAAPSGAQVGSASAPPPVSAPPEQASDAPPSVKRAQRVREGPPQRNRAASSSPARSRGNPFNFFTWASIFCFLFGLSLYCHLLFSKRKEEEEMRIEEAFMSDASPDYEYKILQDGWGLGRLGDNPFKRNRALANEARFGWELHEQLDSDRIRLRRDRSCRERDDLSLGDPYRTIAVFKQPSA